MEILSLNTKEINQDGYHFNRLTKNKIGMIFTAPVDYVPDDCLACDGYVLKKVDYKKLYTVIGSTFNTGEEADEETDSEDATAEVTEEAATETAEA